jgi:hypothetical protein
MNNYLQGTSLLVLSWSAASIFTLAGLTTMFFGFQGYCHIETSCLAGLRFYPPAESMSNTAYQQVIKDTFHENSWEPLVTAGFYLAFWLALGFFVFLNSRRLLLLVVCLHVIVIIYAFLALVVFGGLTARDTNVPIIFLAPMFIGVIASVFYFFLREYFLRERKGLKDRLGLIEKGVQNLVDSLRQIHFLNRRLQEQAPIELIVESGHTSPVVIDHLERVLKDKESTRTFDAFSDEKSLIAETLFRSQLTIDEMSRVYPGQVQKLKTDHGSIRQLLQFIDNLDTWVDDAKNAIAEGSRQLAEGIDESSKDILSRHPQIPHDELLKEFLEEELSLRIDRRIPSINSVDFPWSDKRGSL